MGVPSLFRWLQQRFPHIVANCVEQAGDAQDFEQPNPNGFEVDNFFVDTNGIVHNCAHPDDGPAPTCEEEMFAAIRAHFDRIVGVVRPRRLLYIALDGVAPRAKMNQQRSRRFRAARDRAEAARDAPPAAAEAAPAAPAFDSNVISPGTEFMARVADVLRAYARERLASHPAWKGITVIVSDSNTPGEGEHKIMDFLRRQQLDASYNPEQSHMLYGLDADLLMLGIATRERHVRILREVVQFGNRRPELPTDDDHPREKPYVFVDVHILRSCLLREMQGDSDVADAAPQRVLDDFVFLSFLVGNDFLPSIPSLAIREQGLETLLTLYRENMERGKYLVDAGEIDFAAARPIIAGVAKAEEDVFAERHEAAVRRATGTPRRQSRAMGDSRRSISSMSSASSHSSVPVHQPPPPLPVVEDLVRLWEPGWKERYYSVKFHLDTNAADFDEHRDRIVTEYVSGLQWVARYYYQGVPSWTWYYPHHYAPFASDIADLAAVDRDALNPPRDAPCCPLEQLLAVLPPASAAALPPALAGLMTDAASPVKDMYPETFELDPNGDDRPWMAISLLPFIDGPRLHAQIAPRLASLTDSERTRNTERPATILWRNDSRLSVSTRASQGSPVRTSCADGTVSGVIRVTTSGPEITEGTFEAPGPAIYHFVHPASIPLRGESAAERRHGHHGGSSACYNCGQEGHFARECPRGRRPSGANSGLCFNCQQPGHVRAACPFASLGTRSQPGQAVQRAHSFGVDDPAAHHAVPGLFGGSPAPAPAAAGPGASAAAPGAAPPMVRVTGISGRSTPVRVGSPSVATPEHGAPQPTGETDSSAHPTTRMFLSAAVAATSAAAAPNVSALPAPGPYPSPVQLDGHTAADVESQEGEASSEYLIGPRHPRRQASGFGHGHLFAAFAVGVLAVGLPVMFMLRNRKSL